MKLLRNLKGFKQILYVFHYFNQNGEYSNKKFLFTWFNELFGDQSLDSPVFNDSSFFFFWWWICKFSWFLKSIFTNIDIHFFTVNVRHNEHRSSVWEFHQHFPILLDFFWVIKVTGPWSTYIYCLPSKEDKIFIAENAFVHCDNKNNGGSLTRSVDSNWH